MPQTPPKTPWNAFSAPMELRDTDKDGMTFFEEKKIKY